MNQEQNNLNPNNFNTQGNNGIPNNQPLNNQSFNNTFNQNAVQNPNINQSTFNQQPINPQPQPMTSYEQPINQMNIEQPIPQPMNNTFESGNVSNQSFNSKSPKKMSLGLIIVIVAVVAVVGVGIIFGSKLLSSGSNNNNSENSNNKQNITVEKYEVDLTEVSFKRVKESYVNEIKGNTIQTINRLFQINNEYYNTLFLTKDGYLYLLGSSGDKLIKIEKKINLSFIDGFVESDYGSNSLIYGNGVFYNLSVNGELEKVDSKNIIYPIDFRKEDHFIGITKDKKLTAVLSCENYDKNNTSGKCNSTDNWITVKSDIEFSYANANMLLSTDNKLYSSKDVYSSMHFKYENMKINISDSALVPILENVINYYDTHNSAITLIQTSDNKIYLFDQDLILAKVFEPKVVDFNEKIEKIYGSGRNKFLFLTNNKMYLLHPFCENSVLNCKLVTTDLTNELMEYKDKIRNFATYYNYGEKLFVLLTNGNIYELNVD